MKYKLIFIIFNFIIPIYYYKFASYKSFLNKKNKYIFEKQIMLGYDINKFAIISLNCKTCGLFAIYKHSIACILKYIIEGYIPIIELLSYPYIFNKLNSNNTKFKINPWEIFFNQPYGYSLENVKKKAKNIQYFKCDPIKINIYYPNYSIYLDKVVSDFWHHIANKYIPIKLEILKESNLIIKKLFKGSKNILGVLARGTDYISLKPKGHPKQPDINIMISDTKKMDLKYKYDLIFLTTEDSLIKGKFTTVFKNKIKSYNFNNINYNYKEKKRLYFNEKIQGNFNYAKTYLINIIILSKCIDIICSLTSGTIGAFILTEGFRNTKIYFLGYY